MVIKLVCFFEDHFKDHPKMMKIFENNQSYIKNDGLYCFHEGPDNFTLKTLIDLNQGLIAAYKWYEFFCCHLVQFKQQRTRFKQEMRFSQKAQEIFAKYLFVDIDTATPLHAKIYQETERIEKSVEARGGNITRGEHKAMLDMIEYRNDYMAKKIVDQLSVTPKNSIAVFGYHHGKILQDIKKYAQKKSLPIEIIAIAFEYDRGGYPGGITELFPGGISFCDAEKLNLKELIEENNIPVLKK